MYKFIQFFESLVLLKYKEESDKYDVEEDGNGCRIVNTKHGEWYQVRYMHKKLKGEKIYCIGAFIPDLSKLTEKEKDYWYAHLIENPEFDENDEEFGQWYEIHINDPKFAFEKTVHDHSLISRIVQLVELINSLTKEKFSMPLFKFETNPSLIFPKAENTNSFIKAIEEISNYLVDGLDQEVLEKIALELGTALKDKTKTLNSLKQILDEELTEIVHKPLKDIRDIRSEGHGVSGNKPESYPAIQEFKEHLRKIIQSLSALLEFLENKFNLLSKTCLSRQQALRFFPKLIETNESKIMLDRIENAIGKRIKSLEYGEKAIYKDSHLSDALILHFDDGTSLSIEICSNAQNLSSMYKGLSPNEIHTNLYFLWANAIREKN